MLANLQTFQLSPPTSPRISTCLHQLVPRFTLLLLLFDSHHQEKYTLCLALCCQCLSVIYCCSIAFESVTFIFVFSGFVCLNWTTEPNIYQRNRSASFDWLTVIGGAGAGGVRLWWYMAIAISGYAHLRFHNLFVRMPLQISWFDCQFWCSLLSTISDYSHVPSLFHSSIASLCFVEKALHFLWRHIRASHHHFITS